MVLRTTAPHPLITDWNMHILWKLVNRNLQEEIEGVPHGKKWRFHTEADEKLNEKQE
jgi:hypothetical protein